VAAGGVCVAQEYVDELISIEDDDIGAYSSGESRRGGAQLCGVEERDDQREACREGTGHKLLVNEAE
jgi:hypothetical protein